MKDALIVSVLSVVPKNLFSRGMGLFARTRLPDVFRRALLRWYVGKYRVNLDECEGTLEDYPTLVAFFTRALRPGVRPVAADPGALVAPCDGVVYAVGDVKAGRVYQSDGMDYGVTDLLGRPGYEDGAYIVIYLSPRDYHRVHTPREGEIVRYTYLPGQLWPVFPAATRRVEGLFARNERIVSWLRTSLGSAACEIAVVMVGAFGVGRMTTVYSPLATNDGSPAENKDLAPVPIGRAAELGRFEMGSTVVLVLPRGTVTWSVERGQFVRLGEKIGELGPQN